jgi:molecular chaperone GrpE (heat shock protein)
VDAAGQAAEARARERGGEGGAGEGGAGLATLEARLSALEAQLRRGDDRHGRAEARLDDLATHVGTREPLDITRVPPDILERSMQAALDEICAEVAKVRAVDEVERAVDAAIEDVRGRSKGSELFERAGGQIRVRGLAEAVEKRLLSAKAAQATFDEVIRHLRTHVPGYKPRSLAALIRIRSADYAVEAALAHHRRIKAAEEGVERLIGEARRIEADARAADAAAAEAVSRSLAERSAATDEFHARIKALESRAAGAEDALVRALARLEAVERYAQKVESAMIRRTKEGTFKGDFTPVIDAVHEALRDRKYRSIEDIAGNVKGVELEVVEAVVREGVREGDLEEGKDGRVRLLRK